MGLACDHFASGTLFSQIRIILIMFFLVCELLQYLVSSVYGMGMCGFVGSVLLVLLAQSRCGCVAMSELTTSVFFCNILYQKAVSTSS